MDYTEDTPTPIDLPPPDITPENLDELFRRGILTKDVTDRMLGAASPTETAVAKTAPLVDSVAKSAAAQDVGPEDLSSLIHQEGKPSEDDRQKLLSILVPAVIHQESGGKPGAVSEKGAQGLMQLMPKTGAEVAQKLGMADYNPFNPEQNRQIGTKYLSDLVTQFGDIPTALAAYNAGPGRVGKLLEKAGPGSSYEDIAHALPTETQGYVNNIGKALGLPIPQASPMPTPMPVGTPDAMPQATPGPQMTPTAAPMPDQGTQPAIDPSMLAALQGGSTPAPPASPTVGPAIDQMIMAKDAQIQQSNQALASAQQAGQAGNPQGALAGLATADAINPIALNREGLQKQLAGVQAGANAISQQGQEQAQVQQERQDQIAKEASDWGEKYKAWNEQNQKDITDYRTRLADYSNTTIDPNHLFKSQSTFSTILLGLSAGVAAYKGDTTNAMKIVNDAINRDIEVQKANLDQKQTGLVAAASLLQRNHQAFDDMNTAETVTHNMMIANTQAHLDQILAKNQDPLAQANGLKMQGALQQAAAQDEAKIQKAIGDKNALDKLGTTAGLKPDEMQLFQRQQEGKDKNIVSMNGKPIGQSAQAPAMNSAIEMYQNIQGALSEIDRIRAQYPKTNGIPTEFADADAIDTQIGDIRKELISGAKKGSRMAKEVGANLDRLIPPDISGTNHWMFLRTMQGVGSEVGLLRDPGSKLNQFKDVLNKEFTTDANTLMGGQTTQGFRTFLNNLAGNAGNLPGVVAK